MTRAEDQAAIAAFIRSKGVTRCPTACLAPTNATLSAGNREALRRAEAALAAQRRQRAIDKWRRGFGVN